MLNIDLKKNVVIYPFMTEVLKLNGNELIVFAITFKFFYYSKYNGIIYNPVYTGKSAFEGLIEIKQNETLDETIRSCFDSLIQKKLIKYFIFNVNGEKTGTIKYYLDEKYIKGLLEEHLKEKGTKADE